MFSWYISSTLSLIHINFRTSQSRSTIFTHIISLSWTMCLTRTHCALQLFREIHSYVFCAEIPLLNVNWAPSSSGTIYCSMLPQTHVRVIVHIHDNNMKSVLRQHRILHVQTLETQLYSVQYVHNICALCLQRECALGEGFLSPPPLSRVRVDLCGFGWALQSFFGILSFKNCTSLILCHL